MSKNPFRGKPNLSVQQNTDDWGKTKFKPNKFGGNQRGKGNFKKHQGGSRNKPFDRKFDNRNLKKNNEMSRFNQVDRDAKPENATPWNKFKDGIVFQQREDEQTAQRANMDSEEGKKILKQREISYRKLLIEQKKLEPTHWDDFGEEEHGTKNKNRNKNFLITKNHETCSNNESISKNKKKFKKNKNSNKDPEEASSKLDEKSKPKFKNSNNSNLAIKTDVKELLSKELLDNFDSKKLNFKQNDGLRSIITKTTSLCRRNDLHQIVKNMKYQKQKKEKNYKNK